MPNRRLSKHAVYRHFSEDGVLLYIGTSGNPFERLVCHKSLSSWAHQVSTISIDWFETKEEARVAEKAAIQAEEPLHNAQFLREETKVRNAALLAEFNAEYEARMAQTTPTKRAG